MSNGYQLPDPYCTPGAANPTLTSDVLKNARFVTDCVRDLASSASAKDKVYRWYALKKPQHNTGQNMVCEKDHLVSLEIGGADTLDNIWPQCGPSGVTLGDRYFKQKDNVENYLAAEVKAGRIPLDEAQHGIASDWTQYLSAAQAWRAGGGN
jgi:hypothetical protein